MNATPSKPDAADLLREREDPAQHPEPVDADWPAREADAEEGDEPYGDPADLRDEGVLESLGKAVTAPVKEAAENAPWPPASSTT